ncbi:hypothetical protein BJ912DRAFT_935888 [Pholiota molesta]|nr:hypothetical protein BJ912DRAFT_935888 [Pholiota molesta]
MSQTRDEQFLDSEGPPPLEVPRKVTDIKPSSEDDAGANPDADANVFVTPPEEDETPAWCCFDADNPAFSQVMENPDSPDITVLAFPPTSIPPDSTEIPTLWTPDDDIDSDTESDYGREATLEDDPQAIRESTRHQPRDPRNAADDSDVIEVVKDVFAPSPPVPSLPKYPDTQPLPREEAPSRPRTPTVSRRGSKILTQLFTAPSLKSQSSMSSFDDQAAASPRQSITSPTSSVFSIGNPTSLHNPSIYSAAMQDEARLQAASPTPTTSSSKSATRRFSMQSLQKLFSFSSASPAPPISVTTPIMHDDSSRTTPTPRSTSSTPPSVLSSTSGPQTPTSSEEVTHVRLVSRKDTADIPGFDSFESVFDTNVGLNLGLGLGLNLDPDLDVEKTPRKPNRVQSLKNTWDAVAPKRFSRAPLPSSLDDAEI